MEMILTGNNITAEQAVQWGLVSRVVEAAEGSTGEMEAVVKEAIQVAESIASKSTVAVQAAKAATKAGEALTH